MPDEPGPPAEPPAHPAAAPGDGTTLPRRRSRAWLWRPLAIFAVSRAVTLVAALVAATVAARFGDDLMTDKPFPDPPTGHLTLRALGGWDGGWYARIADMGYPASAGVGKPNPEFAFFPLFPLSIRGLSALTGLSSTATGVALSMLFGFGAAVLLWRLADRLGGDEMADRAVALFSFFPGSMVLSMAYAESMMLTFGLACVLGLLARRWALAGLAAGLATATRPNAIALFFCCAWAAGVAIRERRDWRALLAPALSLTGIAGYFAFLRSRTGETFFWLRVQRERWGESFDFGLGTWRKVQNTLADPLDLHQPREINALIATLGLICILAAAYCLWRWRPPAMLTVYTVVILLLTVMARSFGVRPRFILTAFPLVLAVAWRLRAAGFQSVVALSAGLLGVYTVLSLATTFSIP